MKKLLIGAFVGGIIIFVFQILSWTILNLHKAANQYTPDQNEVLAYLSSRFNKDAQYLMPSYPPDASMEEREKAMKSAEGKPWAIVSYHKEMNMNMTLNIVRGLLVNIFMVGLFCWILSKINAPKFSTILIASLFTGLIVFINVPYTTHIWYETFDLMAYFTDELLGWGVCGLWLGWWYSR